MSAPRERTENASKEKQSAFSFDDDLKMLAEEFDELSFRRCALEHAQQQAQDFDALTGPDEPMPACRTPVLQCSNIIKPESLKGR